MNFVLLIGLVAGFLTTVAYVPEVYRIFITKDTKGISLLWLVILLTGAILWFVYGLDIYSLPVIFANGISALLIVIMLILKLRLH
ncbi:MAG: SemiSWEET transporter [Nitrososphaerota archaeon]|nr:SemiSWEET transporter [Nitrososphaerota archaeon]MDG6932033.1 SemiSWEET transporter [Nitrososphaerota archaeon]MDG6935408.1 SemiSWEET transporter [Nitrososphaerota archaeon]MDG6944572.1 SemiSWEET transporter [Nitrososphaerota archaeon]